MGQWNSTYENNIVQPIIICKTSVNFDGEKAPTKVEKLNRLKILLNRLKNNNKMKPLECIHMILQTMRWNSTKKDNIIKVVDS